MGSIYGVLCLQTDIDVEVFGNSSNIALSWSNGQVGAIPVFKKYEDALNYVSGDKGRVFALELKEN